MRYGKVTLLTAALALALSACGRDDDEYVDATPDMEGLAMEITGAASEGISAGTQGLSGADGLGQSEQGAGAVPEYLAAARSGVRDLNEMLRRALTPIVSLVSRGGRMAPDETRIYGPRDSDGATWRLTVRKVAQGRFAWKLEAKPVGGPDTAYQIIMAGGVQRGAIPHRGRGAVGINLNNLKSVLGDTFPGQGKLLAAYAHVGDQHESKSLAYVLHGFTPNVAERDPVDAAIVGHRLLPSGASGVRLVTKVNIESSETAEKETVALRVRWVPGVGGAGALRAWGGDIAEGTWYRGFACWDATEQEGFKVLQHCTGPASCTDVVRVGHLSSCRPNLGEGDVLPPTDGEVISTAPEAGAPATDPLTPPADVTDETGG
jgi:hypothetical protein